MNRVLRSLVLLGVAGVSWAAEPVKVCDVKTAGALGNGHTKDTAAFQKAIDQCAKTGGGIVRVPAGTYLLTPFELKSHITLELAKDAVLLASAEVADYPIAGETISMGQPQKRPVPLISTLRQTDITIRGEGVIDGAGESWWKAFAAQKQAGHGELPRPWLLQFSESDHITVEGITLKNAPSRPLVPYFSSDITIQNVKILAPPDSPNTDGISPASSHRIRILDCLIDTGSDNIAISSSRPREAGQDSSSSEITIANCTFLHGRGASIGADTGGGIRGVVMENIHFKGTVTGIRIKAGRGFAGEISDITYRHIELLDTSQAISIAAYYPTVPAAGQDAGGQALTATTPRLHDITLEDVKASGGKSVGVIVGLPESPILNLTMRDVHLSGKTGLQIRNAAVTMQNADVQAEIGDSFIREDKAEIRQR